MKLLIWVYIYKYWISTRYIFLRAEPCVTGKKRKPKKKKNGEKEKEAKRENASQYPPKKNLVKLFYTIFTLR